jgi:hypothetical protein
VADVGFASARREPLSPSRPLDPEVDRAILAAAGEIFVRDGFQNMTVPGVVNHLNTDVPGPDTGSAHDDLVTVLEFARLRFDLSVTGTLLTEEREHPELLKAARRQMIVPTVDTLWPAFSGPG